MTWRRTQRGTYQYVTHMHAFTFNWCTTHDTWCLAHCTHQSSAQYRMQHTAIGPPSIDTSLLTIVMNCVTETNGNNKEITAGLYHHTSRTFVASCLCGRIRIRTTRTRQTRSEVGEITESTTSTCRGAYMIEDDHSILSTIRASRLDIIIIPQITYRCMYVHIPVVFVFDGHDVHDTAFATAENVPMALYIDM